jgi:DNA-binding transcriptional regulator YiaG
MRQDCNKSDGHDASEPLPAKEGKCAPAGARILDFAQCRTQRVALGWSLAELAKRTGFSVSTISEFEEGRRSLKEAAIVALQRALRKGLSSATTRSRF